MPPSWHSPLSLSCVFFQACRVHPSCGRHMASCAPGWGMWVLTTLGMQTLGSHVTQSLESVGRREEQVLRWAQTPLLWSHCTGQGLPPLHCGATVLGKGTRVGSLKLLPFLERTTSLLKKKSSPRIYVPKAPLSILEHIIYPKTSKHQCKSPLYCQLFPRNIMAEKEREI